jgi:hypothetical protein
MKSGGESSPVLMKAKLLVLPPATCQKKWKPMDLNYATLESTTICVQSEPRMWHSYFVEGKDQ